MVLSERMKAVAALVTPGSRVADIGCDHGYVPIYLVQERISPSVIAMDVNTGPLERARSHIAAYGLSEYIDTRLSDGAAKLLAGEAETVICAGMGGKLILRILEQDLETVRSLRECILQPQSEWEMLRKWLCGNEFLVAEENMIYEDGKYYPVMKVIPCRWGGNLQENVVQYDVVKNRFGPRLLEERNPVLLSYLKKEYAKLGGLLRSLKETENGRTAGQERRIRELELEIRQFETAFSYYGRENQNAL